MLYVAQKNVNEMDFDGLRWDAVIDTLLIGGAQNKTFDASFNQVMESEKLAKETLDAAVKMLDPSSEEL